MQWSMHCIFPNFFESQLYANSKLWENKNDWHIGGISVIQGALKEWYRGYSLRENKRSLRAINLNWHKALRSILVFDSKK